MASAATTVNIHMRFRISEGRFRIGKKDEVFSILSMISHCSKINEVEVRAAQKHVSDRVTVSIGV